GVEPHTLPVVSVTAQTEDLFGPYGIYVPGSTYFTLLRNGVAGKNGNFQSNEEIDGQIQLFVKDVWESSSAKVSIGGQYTRVVAMMKNLVVDLQSDNSISIPEATEEAEKLN